MIDTLRDCPGTPRHQAVLRAIAEYYRHDPRILAVAVFGSLGRGDWDAHSDLDLDLVSADGVALDVPQELWQLGDHLASVGERVALIIPDGEEAGQVVFELLLQLSWCDHPLSATSPNILDSLRLLTGRIGREAIVAAGLANHRSAGKPLAQLLDECVRYAVVADGALQRRRTWITVELLHRMRNLLLELFTQTHGGGRAFYAFETAEERLQARLGATLPGYGRISCQVHCCRSSNCSSSACTSCQTASLP